MLRFEGWMEPLTMQQRGMGRSEIARQSNLDRKTVRKYLRQPPQGYEARPESQR